MLLEFTVENFLSFKEPCVFSCVASAERQHRDRLSDGPLPRQKILPTSVFFGGNGSGKTNLIKALQFCRFMVLNGVGPEQRIPVVPFKLDSDYAEKPSRFTLEFLSGKSVYRYSIAVTPTAIREETLMEIRSASEFLIFARKVNPAGNSQEWNLKAFSRHAQKDIEFLKFKSRDTLPNRLYLGEMRGKQIELLEPAIAWFRDCLEVVEPHTQIRPFESFGPDDQLESFATAMLREADTGISKVCFEPLAFESLPFAPDQAEKIQENLKEGRGGSLLRVPDGRRIRVRLRQGEIKADRLVAYHTCSNNTEVRFEMSDESHGTQRLIDLLPLLFGLMQEGSRKVFVCDELDTNLHPLIVQSLLEQFLEGCSPLNRAQLMFASHDVTLLDQYLLRRDEIWFVTKLPSGATQLESLSDYKDVRIDTDIQKGYTMGRYSGIPNVGELLRT